MSEWNQVGGSVSEIGRLTPSSPLTLTYDDAVDPVAFIDVQSYTMLEVFIPEAFDGLTMTPLSADDAAGTGKAIPSYYDSSDAKTAFPGIEVSTGDRIVLKAESAALWFLGFRFSSAVTGTITVRAKG